MNIDALKKNIKVIIYHVKPEYIKSINKNFKKRFL